RTAATFSNSDKLYRPCPPHFYFAPSATAQNIADEYQRYPDLPAMFGTGVRHADKEVYWATGFASQQDELAMSFTRTELEEQMSEPANYGNPGELAATYRLCPTNWWNSAEGKHFARRGMWREDVGEVGYRPFDRRWTVLHKNVLTILRKQVMSQLLG